MGSCEWRESIYKLCGSKLSGMGGCSPFEVKEFERQMGGLAVDEGDVGWNELRGKTGVNPERTCCCKAVEES